MRLVLGGDSDHRDRRAQALQLGALLLFAIAVINLSLYQVFVVPDQNREIEFQHSQTVQSDMLDTRNALLEAASGEQSFVEVSLAPSYPPRTLFVNPGTPAGTVRTTELRSMTVVNNSDSTADDITGGVCPGTAETRALEYRSGYNVYENAPTMRIENTVLFREFPGQTVPGSGQQLVTEDSINLLPVRGEYSESGSGDATVEPVPGRTLSTQVNNPEVRVPTAFSEDTWESTLDGRVPADRISVTGSGDSRTLVLDLDGQFTLFCGPTGVNEAPPSGARQGSLTGGSGDGSVGEVNPAGASEVRLVGVSEGTTKSEVEITLKNTDDEAKSLARGRIPFYYTGSGGGNKKPTQAVLESNTDDTLEIRERLETIDEDIEIPAGGTVTLNFDFDEGARDDFYIFSVVYDDGTAADYYVDTPKSEGGGGGGPTADASNSVDAVDEGSTGTLDGSASTTDTGSISTYEWSLPGSPPGSVQITDSDTSTPEATFDATGADVSSDTDVTVELTVTDNQGNTDTDTTTVTVRDTDGGSGNQAPSVTVDSVTYSNSDKEVTVDYTPDDPDGNLDTADFAVTDADGNQVATRTGVDISGQENIQLTETFGSLNNNATPYTVEVTVTDTDGATASDSGSTS